MFAKETVQPARGVKQVQGNGMRHDLAHEPHDFIFEVTLGVRMVFDERHPFG